MRRLAQPIGRAGADGVRLPVSRSTTPIGSYSGIMTVRGQRRGQDARHDAEPVQRDDGQPFAAAGTAGLLGSPFSVESLDEFLRERQRLYYEDQAAD